MVDVSAHTADIPLSLTWGSLCHSHKAEGLVLTGLCQTRHIHSECHSFPTRMDYFLLFFSLLILQTTKDNDH